MADGNMHVWTSMSTCMAAFMDSTNGYMCTNGCFDWLLIYVLLYMLFSVKQLSSMRICTYISNSLQWHRRDGATNSSTMPYRGTNVFFPYLTVNLTAHSRNGTEGIGVKFQWQ